jgi:hypothetical protein
MTKQNIQVFEGSGQDGFSEANRLKSILERLSKEIRISCEEIEVVERSGGSLRSLRMELKGLSKEDMADMIVLERAIFVKPFMTTLYVRDKESEGHYSTYSSILIEKVDAHPDNDVTLWIE